MNTERTLKLGQLATAEHEAKQGAIKIDRLKRELRLYLNTADSPDVLQADKVAQMTSELVDAHRHYESRLALIASLREELGLPRYESR